MSENPESLVVTPTPVKWEGAKSHGQEGRRGRLRGQVDGRSARVDQEPIEAVMKAAHDRRIVAEFSDEGFSGYRKSRGPASESHRGREGRRAVGAVVLRPRPAGARERRRARHLGGLYFDLLEVGVKLRAVSGDDDLRDPIRVAKPFHTRGAKRSAQTRLVLAGGHAAIFPRPPSDTRAEQATARAITDHCPY